MIPHYQNGSTFQPSSIEVISALALQEDDTCTYIHVYYGYIVQMCEGETTPPPLLHEADLIALMEKHGIGIVFK